MKSLFISAFILIPVFAQAQTSTPLSTRVEELLKKRQAKEAREAAVIEKIGSDAAIEKLKIEQEKRKAQLKVKEVKDAIDKRFVPKTPFLNYRPLPDVMLWKGSLHYAIDSYETDDATVKKEYNETHFYTVNELQYSWTKKVLFKYSNTYNFGQTIKNEKRQVSGVTVTPDPDLSNSKFGDHVFEFNYRSHREIFYGHDLDYLFKIIYPFGDAQRAYAHGTGAESNTSSTTASQKGNLKSSFGAKPVFGVDYFSGKDRSRYNFGGSLGYAFSGRYTVLKGTGFWSSNPTGLIVTTDSFVDSNLWFNFQKRPKILKRLFYGFGFNLHLLAQKDENIITTGADGFSWVQRNRTEEHYRLSSKVWMKYMLKDYEHVELTLKAHLPYSYKIKKRIIDEGPDGGGNRQFFTTHITEKVKRRGPIELSATYVRSF